VSEYICQPLSILALRISSASPSETLLTEKFHLTGFWICGRETIAVLAISLFPPLHETYNEERIKKINIRKYLIDV
jgi:hypothetical protein